MKGIYVIKHGMRGITMWSGTDLLDAGLALAQLRRDGHFVALYNGIARIG